MELINKTIDSIGTLNQEVMDKAQVRLNSLLKPEGSLGELESIAKKLAGINGEVINFINKKAIIAMCSDNGVLEEGVASHPKDVSYLVAGTMAKGISGVATLAKHAGSDLKIVDIGLDKEMDTPGIIDRKIRMGTSNIAKGPAMSRDEAVQAINAGIEITNEAIKEGVNLLGTGEVGIGNTTTSSAILYALTGGNLDELVGRGAGLTDEGLVIKKKVIKNAVELNKPDSNDPIDILAKVGGFDIAGLVGCYLAAAAGRTPIVIDGFISGTAAVIALKIKPESLNFMFASHISEEPGAKTINEILNLEPMLKMNMRLGEGTGCALAFNIIEAATVIMSKMGTFADIGM